MADEMIKAPLPTWLMDKYGDTPEIRNQFASFLVCLDFPEQAEHILKMLLRIQALKDDYRLFVPWALDNKSHMDAIEARLVSVLTIADPDIVWGPVGDNAEYDCEQRQAQTGDIHVPRLEKLCETYLSDHENNGLVDSNGLLEGQLVTMRQAKELLADFVLYVEAGGDVPNED